MRYLPALALLLCATFTLAANPDPRIHQVKTIFVTGNDQLANSARQVLAKGKTCLALGAKAADADAVLDVGANPKVADYLLGTPGGAYATNAPSSPATLTLKSGELIWSKSKLGDGKDIVRELARDACGRR